MVCPKTTFLQTPRLTEEGWRLMPGHTVHGGAQGTKSRPLSPIQAASPCTSLLFFPVKCKGLGLSLGPLLYLDNHSVLPSSPGLLWGHLREGHSPLPHSSRPGSCKIPSLQNKFIPPPNPQAVVSDLPAVRRPFLMPPLSAPCGLPLGCFSGNGPLCVHVLSVALWAACTLRFPRPPAHLFAFL